MSVAPSPAGAPWTILRLILWSATYLKERGVAQGRLDAEHLLAHALGVDRLRLYLEHDRPLTPEELAAFKPLLLRRAAREPLQHVVGRTPFRELDLITDRRALIPRHETEVLVDVALQWARRRTSGPTLTAADVGTGTGCIALSLALEGPFHKVVGSDASDAALELAALNRDRLGLESAVELRGGWLLEPLAGERFDLLISNPPYVADGEAQGLEPEVRNWDPPEALFAGPEGLDVIRPLVAGAADVLAAEGLLALEVGADQTRAVAALVRSTGRFQEPRVGRDLAGRPRVVSALLRA